VKITANCTRNRLVEVDAHVFGEWAAHPGIDGDDLSERLDWWVVTHVPTGRTICSAVGRLDEPEAKTLASALGERLPAGLIPSIPMDISFDYDFGAEQVERTKALYKQSEEAGE